MRFAALAGRGIGGSLAVLVLLASVAAGRQPSGQGVSPFVWGRQLKATGVQGGLAVIVGTENLDMGFVAAAQGPFLVQVLDRDPAAVEQARKAIEAKGLYGLITADRLSPEGKLPYSENLVNLIVADEAAVKTLTLNELFRVLCPHGVLLVSGATPAELQAVGFEGVKDAAVGASLVARKPRPAGMDEWSHPRHGPDANPVSRDQLVGPPRRVRWVAGPQQEVANMVSAAGRNFYAGVLARDSFNGLRLWERPLRPSPARGGYGFKIAEGSVRPVAQGDRLFVVTDKKLMALSAATGEPIRDYPEAGTPLDVMVIDGLLIAVDAASVRAVEAGSGKLRWKHAAEEPRYVVAGDGSVYLVEGNTRRGQKPAATALDLAKGTVRWQHRDYAWLSGVRGCVYHRGMLAYETSTLNDDKPGNLIRLVSADEGTVLWNRTFVPGMTHMKQARAMFTSSDLWILDDGKCSILDLKTGEPGKSYEAGTGHCFPPVASEKYLFAGELNMTDLATGEMDANRITKGNCSRDAGWVLANGLIYTTPKHCVCWPMLRDYNALATERSGDPLPKTPSAKDIVLETGGKSPLSLGERAGVRADGGGIVKNGGPEAAQSPHPNPLPMGEGTNDEASWPCYRHDSLRSSSTSTRVPANLRVLWKTSLGAWPEGTIAADWRANSYVRGPVTPPVAAGGLVYVARPDAHQVVALDAKTGQKQWTFTANGRIDTPPTIHRGLCLFGTRSGWVYCLRADDGQLVWRLRAAPRDERIVAYGQVESPWPVAGSVLVVEDVAFFAAGRQPLADGGILVFAAEPATGKVLWVQRIDSVPQTNFYGGAALEFEAFDLLQQNGPAVAMSRWLLDRKTGQVTCDEKNGFVRLASAGGEAIVPQGCWSYGPRYESEQVAERPHLDPLVAFCGSTLFGGSQDCKTLYRRDFNLAGGEKFDAEWSQKWSILKAAREGGGDMWRSQRLARGAKWTATAAGWLAEKSGVSALVLTADALFIAGAKGGLAAVSPSDGSLLAQTTLPPPTWDGMAAIAGRLLVTTQDGQVICLGAE